VISLVKIDEDLPRQVADLVAERGYDATTVVGQGWQGMSDGELWPRVQDEGRWLITADKGFADLRAHPAGSHAGVILLRAPEESRRAYLELAAIALDWLNLETLLVRLWW
jgi:predicted nuclease of predicted toxin-antitoxin system